VQAHKFPPDCGMAKSEILPILPDIWRNPRDKTAGHEPARAFMSGAELHECLAGERAHRLNT
jgi:hypothetical protein